MAPASVRATLRVVRFSRRTPRRHAAQALTEARYGNLLLNGRAPKIEGTRHGGEGCEVAEDIIHCSKE
jgi:hypothetical protein